MKKILTLTAVVVAAGLAHAAVTPIEGDNTVGLVKLTVPTSATHTIISVPFVKCLTSSAESGMLKDLICTNGLVDAGVAADADQLIVLTMEGANKVYYYYWLQTGLGWTPVTTTVLMPDGSSVAKNPPPADEFAISRGLGFWLKRYSNAAESSLYLKGQVTTAKQATVITNGLNLVGYGYTDALTLNDVAVSWTGANGGTGNTTTSDKIIVVNPNGTFSEYFFFTRPIAWTAQKYVDANNKWINNDYSVANVTIPAGKGFWYLRRGTAGFTFRPKGE